MSNPAENFEQLITRAVNDLSAGYAGVLVSIGSKLGLYQALSEKGPVTSIELAKQTGYEERYVREWLNAQVAGRYIEYEPDDRNYYMTVEQKMIFADQSSPTYIPNAWEIPASMWADENLTISAFRSGEGVPWGAHDDRLFCGVAAFFRNAYRGSLISEWLPAMNGVVEKLEVGANVLDVGCGHGHSTLLMAESYPNSHFHGVDNHPDSIDSAMENTTQYQIQDNVDFSASSAAELREKNFDLICFFDCLHDMGDPVNAAAAAYKALKPDGHVMLIEPCSSNSLEENINAISRMYYCASTTLCCAHAISENSPNALGAQAGESRLQHVFTQAGFSRFHRVAETPFNLVFEARI